MKVNDVPLSIAAVVVISSPKKIGTVPLVDVLPIPTICPAFLLANTRVYPATLFPEGEVVGVNETCPEF